MMTSRTLDAHDAEVMTVEQQAAESALRSGDMTFLEYTEREVELARRAERDANADRIEEAVESLGSQLAEAIGTISSWVLDVGLALDRIERRMESIEETIEFDYEVEPGPSREQMLAAREAASQAYELVVEASTRLCAAETAIGELTGTGALSPEEVTALLSGIDRAYWQTVPVKDGLRATLGDLDDTIDAMEGLS
ncbi:MAG TPA: hypothetical protein PKW90_24850 [Myxococcota bacterium]|nr:hypothetical protein [Myxococcota bacterium]